MDFGYERASGVNNAQLALLRFVTHSWRHSVGAENQNCAVGNFGNRFNENRAALAELLHDVTVVHNFVMDVHRRPVNFQRQLDDIHGAHHAGAETARPYAQEHFAVCGRASTTPGKMNQWFAHSVLAPKEKL